MVKRWLKSTLLIIMILLSVVGFTACNKVEFKIDFIVDNSVYATVKTYGEETIEMPEDPAKEGFVFEGWYLDEGIWEKAFTESTLLNEPLSSDMKVYAKFVVSHEHQYNTTVVSPSCDDEGYTIYKCACGEQYTDDIVPATGHTYNKKVLDEEYLVSIANCIAPETYHFSCACGKEGENTFTVGSIDLNGHNYVDFVCTHCGDVISKVSSGLEYTLSNDGMSYSVSGGTCTDSVIVIPATYEGKPVITIAEDAFSRFSNLTNIVIPGSVTTICKDAFRGCTGLTSVTIPGSVTNLNALAFQGCSNLSSINVSTENVQYKSIDGNLYSKDGKKLIQYAIGKRASSFTIPESVMTVGEGAFLGCTNLTNIIIPSGVTIIEEAAFLGCSEIISIEIPNGVATISDSTFFNCFALTNITIPSSVTKIGGSAFYDCTALAVVNYAGTKAQWNSISIGSYNTCLTSATINCNGGHKHVYTAVVTPPTCTEQGFTTHTCGCGDSYVDTYVSASSHNYDTVLTSPTCTERGYITYTCTNCGDSYVDNYVKAAGHSFTNYVSDGNATTQADGTKTAHCDNNGCSATDTITDVGSKLPDAHTHSYNSTATPPTCTQQGFTTYTCGCGDSYQGNFIAATGHKFDSLVCSQCSTNITNHAIESYDVSVNLDGKITAYVVEIDGAYSLYVLGTGEMKNYTSSNTPLYNDGYYNKITTVYIGDSIDSIGDYFLYLCMKVTDIRIPSTLKSIGEFAIAACDALDDISLPNGLTNIENYAFYSSGNITTVTIPSTVTTVGQNAFKDCTKLANIIIGENSQLKVLGNAAFSNTAYYNDSSNWDGKVLYIDCCLIKAKTTISGEFTVSSNVKVIAENAFDSCTSLTKIIVPDNVTSIGKSAFYKCDGLKFIQLPFTGATQDGTIDANFGYVFGSYSGYGNSSYIPTSLTEVVITGGDKIDSHAFYGCNNLVTLTLPYVGTSLNSGEFIGSVFGSTNTSNHVLPDSLTTITILSGSITAHAFHGCDDLINVTIGEGVTSIGEGAFYNCSSIQSIKLPFVGQNASVTSGYNAVFGYIFGYGVKTISYGTTGTGANAYWSMSDYDISINQYSSTVNGKQSIYYYKIPSTLKTVVITNATAIPQSAFYKCSMLDTVIIPKNATMYSGAFDSCPATVIRSCKEGEHNVITIAATAPTCTSTGNTEGTKCSICGIVFSGNLILDTLEHQYDNGSCKVCGEKKASEGLIFTLNEDTDTYIVSGIGTCTDANVIIPARYKGKAVTTIGEEAFKGCVTMESITIPVSITKSHSYAFSGCTSLKAVYIEDIVAWCSISFINMRYSNPLEQAGNLYLNGVLVKDLVIPNGATKIGTLAFINCQSLTSIEIPNSVTYISQGAFDKCINLKTVKLGTGITEIWDSFTGCTSLENLYIYDLEKYCNIEFVNGSSGKPLQYATKLYLNNVLLTTITVPSGITNFSNAFAGYKSLQKIILPSTITAITSNAFSGCIELTEVVINEGPTKIESNAFYNCIKLKNIVIPDSVLSIADSAFKNCTGLETITIGDGVTAIPSNCFTDLDNLVSVIIGDGVTQIGTGAFSYCDNLQEVTFGDNVKTIDTFAFGQCYALKSVVLPKALETIGSQAFYYCKGLEKIEFSSSLKKIGSEAFYCCDNVTSMIFNGTQAQWNSISKGSNWNRNIPVGITIKS